MIKNIKKRDGRLIPFDIQKNNNGNIQICSRGG